MNRPAPVEISYENMRFLITHNPTNATLYKFTEELKKYGVTTLVRVCDAGSDSSRGISGSGRRSCGRGSSNSSSSSKTDSWTCGRRRAGPPRSHLRRPSMPSPQLASVFRWNIRCTFMASLNVKANFCQAQHSLFADK